MRKRDVELTNQANISNAAMQVGDYELSVNWPAYVEVITRIKGMRSWRTRVKRRRAGPEDEAENWEDVEETHEAGKAGRNANAPNGDEARIQPLS